MQRLTNPGMILPEATKAIQELVKVAMSAGVPPTTMKLVHLRASQINGCSFCTLSGSQAAKEAGETDERLFTVAAWREAPFFDEAERAALGLTEAMTRLSDREDAVPDEVWDDAAKHYDERQLGALVLWIGTSNLFNRINVTIHQPAGELSFA